MARDGLDAERELVGDLAIALAGGDQPQDLDLARRQPARAGAPAEKRRGALRLIRRPELLEDGERAPDRKLGAVGVADRAARAADQPAHLGGLERAVEGLPQLPRAPE